MAADDKYRITTRGRVYFASLPPVAPPALEPIPDPEREPPEREEGAFNRFMEERLLPLEPDDLSDLFAVSDEDVVGYTDDEGIEDDEDDGIDDDDLSDLFNVNLEEILGTGDEDDMLGEEDELSDLTEVSFEDIKGYSYAPQPPRRREVTRPPVINRIQPPSTLRGLRE